MDAEEKRSPSLTYFLGQFWRSFSRSLVLYLIILVVLLGLPVFMNLQHRKFGFEENPVLIAAIPLLLVMCFCAGWAGAMLRCNTRNVAATGALGAFIIATLSFVILISLQLVAGNVTLGEAIIFPVVIFFVSWFMIAWAYFSLNFWGPAWW